MYNCNKYIFCYDNKLKNCGKQAIKLDLNRKFCYNLFSYAMPLKEIKAWLKLFEI